ncbi:MAG: hypothetical protein IJT91_04105 [Clostridia bacterium]|nr:hypothetical protein [Clostridia bacterium]
MRTVLIVIYAALALLYIRGIFALFKKERPGAGSVALPKYMLICGLVCGIFFLILSVITLRGHEKAWITIIFGCLSFLGAALVLGYINCVITYDDYSFTSKSFFGVKRTYNYSEVTGIKGGDRDVKIYVGGHVVRVDEIAEGRDEFLTAVRRNYVPSGKRGRKKRKDIFNGNVENPGEFVFVYILIGVLMIGALVYFTLDVLNADYSPEAFAEVRVSSYKEIDGDLCLFAAEEKEPYVIADYKKTVSDPDGLLEKCNGNYVFKIGYYEMEDDGETYRQAICVRRINGNEYLTLEDGIRQKKTETFQLVWLFLAFVLLWAVFVILSICIGRHPEKFSRKIVHLFFKPGYVKTDQIPHKKPKKKSKKK